MNTEIGMKINGQHFSALVANRLLLVDFIRETAELTGTHVGCATEGRCGACTVLVNGEAIKSCLMLAVQADGADVVTVEGLARNGDLHPIQQAFWENHGLQCGYCTPGMLMALVEFLRQPSRDEAAIRTAMSGVLCPCTGYVHTVDSVRAAIDKLERLGPDARDALFEWSAKT